MKREGDGMPWTAPRKCKRSRLCVSTAGSPDGHLHLVLHFKRRSSFLSLTPSNRVETTQEHRRKPCVDRRINGKIVKPRIVGNKDRTVGKAKKRPTQLKSVHELEMKSLKSCESHGLESGNKSYVNKVADQKVPEPSTLMRKEERTSHTKEKLMRMKSGKEYRNSTINYTRRYKVKYNGYPSHKQFTPLLNLRTVTTAKTVVKRTPKPNPCHKVTHYNSGHCSEPLENDAFKVKLQQKPSLQKNHVCVGTTVEDSRHSKWYVSPITHTRNEEKQLKHIDEKRCNQGEKLAKTKTMSDTATQKLHPDSNRKDSKWEVTEIECKKKQTVSDNQKLSKQNKPGKKPAILEAEFRTALSIGLFPTCPWEVESDDSSDDSDGKETKDELNEVGKEQLTVPDKQQLSKVHKPAWKLQGATCERTIEPEVQHRNTSCTKAESTWSPTGTSGATLSTAEKGRSEKKNFLKEGQSRYAGKSDDMTITNSASLHGQQRQLKNMCKEENIVEILQDKLIITKDCDNTKDFNGPITSADTSDVINDVMKCRRPIRKDFGSSSGGRVQNGPITVRNGSAEDVVPATVGMKQAAGSVSSPRKLDLEVADLMTLAPHEWLNDNVLNGYFDLLSEARPDHVYCYNTFFYTQLCRKGYQGVRRWTRKVQIFQKCLLLVPLHLGNHWCLAEVAVQDRLLYLYDSRGGANLTCLQRLVSYLCCEAEERGEAEFTSGWDGRCKEDIPVQETSGDCGVFVCQYARCIVEGRPMDFSQKDMPKFRCQMTQELLQHKLL